MTRVTRLIALVVIVVSLLTMGDVSHAGARTTLVVCPECPLDDLAAALRQVPAGATIEVRGGVYAGPLLIDRPLTLVGRDWPVIEGGGQGTVVIISAPDVRLEGFIVRGSGSSHDREDSGIRARAARAAIVGNRVLDSLFGIYLENAPDSLVERNLIIGKELPEPARGDGLKIWYSPRAQVLNNELHDIRDALVWYSDDTVVQGNHISRARYGLHFMYSQRSLVEQNVIEDNSVGIYLMYGARQTVRANVLWANRGPSGYGLAIKETDGVVVEQNLIHYNRVGIYIDNSPLSPAIENRIVGNWISYNDTGLLLTPATRRNRIAGNTILENLETVAVSGGGRLVDLEWAEGGRGNFWSDYAGYDADGDGIGDIPYRDEPLFESMTDRYPILQFFRFSLAATAIDLAARAVPLFRPEPRVTDPAPLVAPGTWPAIPWSSGQPRWPHALLAVGLLALGATGLAAPWHKRLFRRAGVMGIHAPTLHPAPTGEAGSTGANGTRGETSAQGIELCKQAPLTPGAVGCPVVIQVEHLTKYYGKRLVLDDLSFVVHKGEAVALCGPNGAGKTTVLRCLLGRTSYTGEIRIDGLSPIRDGARVRSRIGYVPQQLPVLDLAVGDLLELIAALRGEPVERSWERLADFNLRHAGAMPIRSLSGGMQQRLALVLALVGDPPILFLDEPTANLDATSREELLRHLQALRDGGRTIVFTSHRHEDVWRLATRVIRLEYGRQQEQRVLVPSAPAGRRLALSLELEDGAAVAASHLLQAHGFTVYRHDRLLRVLVEADRKAEPFLLLGQVGIRVVDFSLEETDAW
jgi:nitrous oxidase accessory protein